MTDIEGGAKSVLDEIASVKKNLPDIEIQTETSHFCTVIYSYAKLPHRRIKLTLTFPETYPSRALIVDVAAERGIPPGLKKKIEKELGEVAEANEGRFRQIEPVLARLKFFVDTNKFVSCWKELKQVVDCIQKLRHIDDYKKSAISINEAKGLIHLKLWNGEYFYFCSLTINDAYPTTISNHDWGKACFLVRDKTNLPSKIEHILTTQAQELIRRMQDGMSADDALLMSNPVKAPRGMEFCRAAKITATVPKGTKVAKGGGSSIGHAENIPNGELPEWAVEEQSRMAAYCISSYDGAGPQPSLLALVNFLVNKIQRLADMTCPICKAPSLPKDPKILSSFYEPAASVATAVEKRTRKVAQMNRPIRTYCGCWYHYKCLHTFMTQPPFGAACPVDAIRVFHPDWPADMQELERAWALKQAKEREIEDAAMAFM